MHPPGFHVPDERWLDRARVKIHAVLAQPEPAADHIRNALTILRFSLEHDEPILGNGCPAVAVAITSLARIQARLEAALAQLEPVQDAPDYHHPLEGNGRRP